MHSLFGTARDRTWDFLIPSRTFYHCSTATPHHPPSFLFPDVYGDVWWVVRTERGSRMMASDRVQNVFCLTWVLANLNNICQWLLEILYIEIISVKTAVKYAISSPRLKPTCGVIPDSPQLETQRVNSTQCSPEAEQFLGSFFFLSTSTSMKFNHQLFDVSQAFGTGEDGVKWTPFRAFYVDL